MRKEKGTALVTVLITAAVLAILGSAIAAIAWQRLNLAVSYENLNGAMYAAEAGIEEMKANINGVLPDCTAYVKSSIEQFVESSEYTPGTDLNAKAREYTRQYLLQNYLMAADPAAGSTRIFSRDLGEMDASYTVQFAQSDYDNTSDPKDDYISIHSTGTYGPGNTAVSKTVTARMRLRYQGSFEVVADGGKTSVLMNQPVIIYQHDTEPFSLRADCRSFTVVGPFYLPKGMHGLSDIGNSSFNFTDDLIVDDDFVLQGDHKVTEVGGSMMVNGELKLSEDKKKMELYIDGDLVVNGNLVLDGDGTKVVVNGDLRCNGSVILNSGASVSLTIYGDGFIQGTIDNTGAKKADIRIVGNTVYNQYGGNIPVFNKTPVPADAFTSDNGAVNLSVINKSMGTITDPVVIFNDGDITIDLSEKNDISINGLIYATGYIYVTGMGSQNKSLYIRGNLISGRKLDINGGMGDVTIELDGSVTERIDPDVLEAFGSGSSTVVRVGSAAVVDRWSE